jgi:hypothetical protein
MPTPSSSKLWFQDHHRLSKSPPWFQKPHKPFNLQDKNAAGINSLRFRKLYSTFKKHDMKASSIVATPDHALRMAQSKQSILQSFNIQVANLNKIEAASIFTL